MGDTIKPTIRISGLIVDDGRVLLVQQARGDDSYWLLPGGSVEYGETMAEALQRECLEELCLEVFVGIPLALVESISDDQSYPKHVIHVIMDAAAADAGAMPRISGNDPAIVGVRFATPDELDGLDVRPPVTRFLKDAMRRTPRTLQYLGVVW
jgi:8-oxo-dGTP diphosphatase